MKRKIEYQVRQVTRYVVTRYEESEYAGSSSVCGTFDREDEALRVGFALAKNDMHEFYDEANVKFPDFPDGWEYYPKREKSRKDDYGSATVGHAQV